MERELGFRGYEGMFLLFCLLLVLIFGYVIMKPFIKIFLIALILATISQPVYRWLFKRTKGKASLSALLTCFLVVIFIIAPSVVMLTLIARESVQIYEWVNEQVQMGGFSHNPSEMLLELKQRIFPNLDLQSLIPQLGIDQLNLGQTLTKWAGNISGLLVNWSAGALKALTTTLWQFTLVLFALYYFLKDGVKFLHWVMHLTPLPGSLEREIFQRFRDVSESAFYGTFLTAIIQGALGGIGFAIVGLPALIWGVAMAFLSLIPLVGSPVVWVPAVIYLFAKNSIGSGIFLTLWGAVIVGLSDNLLRPVLMRGKSALHPLLIFFAILGGVFSFGLLGILLGPLAIVLVIAMLQAYEKEAGPVLEALDKR